MSDRRPPHPEELDAALVDRYLAGECSAAEQASVRRLLMREPAAAMLLRSFVNRLDGAGDAGEATAMPSVDEAWTRLQARLSAVQEPRAEPARPAAPSLAPAARAPRARWWASPWRAALSGGVVAAALLFVALRLRVERAERFNDVARTYVTPARERADIRLSDGTRVRVAPGSRLTVMAGYGEGRREVSLDGEAFFDVVHDASRPFLVVAGTTIARDIGTAFSVRSYPQDSAVQVVVREGRVGVPEIGTLGAGDVGRVARDGRVTVRRRENVDALLHWVDGQLVFIDAPLGKVLQDVRRWYGVDVRVADPALERLPFTGALADVRSSTAVELVAVTLGLRVRADAERLVLEAVPGRTPRATTRAAGRSSRR